MLADTRELHVFSFGFCRRALFVNANRRSWRVHSRNDLSVTRGVGARQAGLESPINWEFNSLDDRPSENPALTSWITEAFQSGVRSNFDDHSLRQGDDNTNGSATGRLRSSDYHHSNPPIVCWLLDLALLRKYSA